MAYCLDLGFNWYSETIGDATGSTSTLYPLQFGLIRNGKPKWFQFQPGNKIFFMIYNLGDADSSLSPQTLTMILTHPVPSTEAIPPVFDSALPGAGGCPWTTFYEGSATCAPFGFPNRGQSQCWALGDDSPKFVFQDDVNMTLELSVVLVVQGPDGNGGTMNKTYVGDPEMWVGEDPG